MPRQDADTHTATGLPRTRIVVLGSGWGAISFLRGLDPKLTSGRIQQLLAFFLDAGTLAAYESFASCPCHVPKLVSHTHAVIDDLRRLLGHTLLHRGGQ